MLVEYPQSSQAGHPGTDDGYITFFRSGRLRGQLILLLGRLLCGWWKHSVQTQIVRVLTVMVRPIAGGEHNYRRSRHLAVTQQRRLFAQAGIVDRREVTVAQ